MKKTIKMTNTPYEPNIKMTNTTDKHVFMSFYLNQINN